MYCYREYYGTRMHSEYVLQLNWQSYVEYMKHQNGSLLLNKFGEFQIVQFLEQLICMY